MRHRRIPGKKRKGPKDLDGRLEKRQKELQQKINANPGNVDDQEIPRKFRELLKAKDRINNKGKLPNSKKKPKAETYEGKKLLDSTLSMG